MNYFIITDANGNGIGGGYNSGDLGAGQTACTEAQSLNPAAYAVVSGEVVAAPDSVLLAQAKTAQIALVTKGYEAAIAAPVTYTTAAGVTALFSTDAKAVGYLQGVIATGSTAWTSNLWLSNSGTPLTPFTFADVQGLAAAIEARDTPDYQELLKLIGEINAATTVTAVQTFTF